MRSWGSSVVDFKNGRNSKFATVDDAVRGSALGVASDLPLSDPLADKKPSEGTKNSLRSSQRQKSSSSKDKKVTFSGVYQNRTMVEARKEREERSRDLENYQRSRSRSG